MDRRLTRAASLVAAALCLAGVTAAARQDAAPPAGSGEGLPDGSGKAEMVKMCSLCHQPVRAASLRLTREGWQGVLEDMVKRGAKGTDDDRTKVLEYLTTNFLGEAPRPINVNSAPQIDLESVIGLLRSEARALVTYREKNGPCAAIDDLKKVPGLDFKKIEAAKDRIVCF